MTRRTTTLAPLLLVALALAGCSGGGGDGESTTTSTSRGPTSTSPAGVATAVEIVSFPESAAPGANATVCWTVTGAGTVPHTAIHWDNASHAAEAGRTFASYDLGASYPNNRTSPSPAGYEIRPEGTRFCTSARMPSEGSIFVVAHVIDSTGPPGRLSSEREIDVAAGDPDLRIQGFNYVPPSLTVARGETVVVQNVDSAPHTVTGNGFDTGEIAGGAMGSFVAPAAPGQYDFFCAYHSAMRGTLTVS